MTLKRTIDNGKMLKNSGSWMYCSQCGNTVGYLCYTTYTSFRLTSVCICGATNCFELAYEKVNKSAVNTPLLTVKNRLCCPEDRSPLFSVSRKNLKDYTCEVVCNKCGIKYHSEMKII